VILTTGFYAEVKKEILVVAEVDPRFFRSQLCVPSTFLTITADGKKLDLKSLYSIEQVHCLSYSMRDVDFGIPSFYVSV
jgi:hypothetical protein